MLTLNAVDFETKPIGPRPAMYPPEPVGLAIRAPDGTSRYWAFGHPSGNNCTVKEAQSALRKVWGQPKVFHNAGFDLSVAIERWGFPYPPAGTVHDSLWRAFFADPYSPSFSLKPLAERYLKLPPNEAEAVREWLVGQKIVRKSLKVGWGAHIGSAPGDLVGPYAIGDVERTYALWQHLEGKGYHPEAYAREQSLLPVLLYNEREGVPVSLPRLRADVRKYNAILTDLDRELQRQFRRKFNLDSNEELADAIEKRYRVKLPPTPTGERQVNKGALDAAVPEGKTKGLLLYRSALGQSLSTFLRPWLEMAADNGGRIHTHWNSTRGGSERKKNAGGARTGRLSSEPNFQNLTADQEKLQERLTKLLGEPQDLPVVRSYIVAPRGFTLIGGDYSQQELRMLAHFEEGPLQKAYNEDRKLQVHKWVQQRIIDTTGRDPGYKKTKIINFAIIYGAGIEGLAAQLECSPDEARELKNAYFKALPSVKGLMDELQFVGRSGDHITTLGGRDYLCEPARKINGKLRTFEYKLLNYLVQGSSADQTKQATINFQESVRNMDDARFLILAHDEIVGICPTKDVKKVLKKLEEAMLSSLQINVPIAVDLESGRDWGNMKEVNG